MNVQASAGTILIVICAIFAFSFYHKTQSEELRCASKGMSYYYNRDGSSCVGKDGQLFLLRELK